LVSVSPSSSASRLPGKLFWPGFQPRVADLRVRRAPTGARNGVRPEACTSSRDDPEVLAFLDGPGTEHDGAADRAVIEGIDTDLVFDWIDELAELAAKLRRLKPRSRVALEDAGPYPESSVATSSCRPSSAMS
jgi:hypothetical protein